MLRNNRFKSIVVMCAAVVVLNCSTKAFAKHIISNSLTATIIVEEEFTVGDGDKYGYSDVNEAINAAKEGQTIKLQGKEYNLSEDIKDKKVTLESADGKYVDIIVHGKLPNNIILGDKVTINKKDKPAINLTGEIVKGNNAQKMEGTITLNVKSGETVFINVSEKVINKLGFHNAHLMLNLDNNADVTVSKNKNKPDYTEIETNKDGEYDLGKITDDVTAKIYLTFTGSGTYEVQIYANDNRENE